MNEVVEEKFFSEYLASAEDTRRVIVGGGKGRSRRINIYVLRGGGHGDAARRLYDALFEYLPPNVFNELAKLFRSFHEQ